jgi:hypothetical protein
MPCTSAGTGSGRPRRCRYCQQSFLPSSYCPQQSVCNNPDCQRRRKADYHRNRRQRDPVYAQTCKNSQENWRREHPDYNRQYRQTHPGAVERNRERERRRYRYHQLADLAKNNLAFDLKRSAAEVWLFAPAGAVFAKNSLASSQVFIVQHVPPAPVNPNAP